jgi:predicted GH43/DUF377 family glycosyl hydrolase
MFYVRRNPNNPIIASNNSHPWRQLATFNPSPAIKDGKLHILYRAMTDPMLYRGERLPVSSIGHTVAEDGRDTARLGLHNQLIAPEEEWERFGCEDPRITLIGDTYYIFYTAISRYPFEPDGIRCAVAMTKDFVKIDSRHLVTPFNAKAMTLFPEKIGGKWLVLLTANSDLPPSHLSFASLDSLDQLRDNLFWVEWYAELEKHAIDLRREQTDHVEVGAAPIKTDKGWLLVYSHIQNYFSDQRIFGIEAILLDLEDPRKIIGRTSYPFMVPEESYEQYGQLADIVFPSGALVEDNTLTVYYGGCDTVCCTAELPLDRLLATISRENPSLVKRYKGNPILKPEPDHIWENRYVLNPTAIDIDGTVHILYRAMGEEMTSTVGYANSRDGLNIDYRYDQPAYLPRADFEKKLGSPDGNSGCEDARIVRIGDRLYITYTGYNGQDVPAVAASSIGVDDFVNQRWNRWSFPELISPPGVDDKDAAIFPEKVRDQYMVLHRVDYHVCADFIPELDFTKHKLTRCIQMFGPRPGMWDSRKVGIAGPPFRTDAGWVLFYHGITGANHYLLGAVLLDPDDPTVVLGRSAEPLMEPTAGYEREGWIANVVFPCGQVVRDETVYLYYGGADQVVAVATMKLPDLLSSLK